MQQIDHRIIKLIVGVIAVSLALFMQIASVEPLHSISESYYYQARDWFVGLLFAVSALFLSFKGENGYERKLTILASLCAALVAVAPCECGRSASLMSALHFPAAAGVFAIMGYFCWRFRKTAKSKTDKYPEAQRRAQVYTACLLGMSICGVMAIAYVIAGHRIDAVLPNYLFWLEAIGLISFGVSWLTASRTIPIITNPRERFHVLAGRAQEDQNPFTATH